MNLYVLPDDKKKGFFSLLRLDYQGLEKVKQAILAEDYDKAMIEMHNHIIHRKKPVYFRGWDKRILDKTYNTKKADQIYTNFIHGYQWRKKIDWHSDPMKDLEFPCAMSRHDFLNTLGEAYWYTGNEKYSAKFVELITDWIKENPIVNYMNWYHTPPDFTRCVEWEPINAGIRLYSSWIHCLYYFRYSKFLTPDVLVTILYSIWEQAHYIRQYCSRLVHRGSNWNLMDNCGMAIAGIMFPEFEEADQWYKIGMVRLDEQVALQFNEEGIHDELCTGYHIVSLFSALMPIELSIRNNLELPHTYGHGYDILGKIEKAIEFIAYTIAPNGELPMIGDGDRNDIRTDEATYGVYEDINNMNMLEDRNDLRTIFKIGARLFNRSDFLYLATCGKQGNSPVSRSISFSKAGYYVMRDSANELYLFFEAGRLGGVRATVGHAHADTMQIIVGAYGKMMLVDPGRYMYETNPISKYLVSSKAHNTLVIDNADSSEPIDRWWFKNEATGNVHHWVTSPHFDYVEGSHDGYQRLAHPLTHFRKVFFVKGEYWVVADFIVGEGMHKYDIYYHLGHSKVKIEPATGLVHASFDNSSGLILYPGGSKKLTGRIFIGSKKPVLGWFSPYYGMLETIPTVRYSAKGQTPISFATVIYPYFRKKPDLKVKIEPLSGNPLNLLIGIESARFSDTICLSLVGDEHKKFGEYKSDGILSFVRENREGNERKTFLIGDTFLSIKGEEELRKF